MTNPYEGINEVELFPSPTKEKVLELINVNMEVSGEFELLREISAGGILTLLDVEFKGKEPGETIQFTYYKAGVMPNGVLRLATSIDILYLQDGEPVGGDTLATYDRNIGEWKVEL